MKTEKIWDATALELSQQLVGKRIAAASGNIITLTDGTVLELEDTADCCAYFNASDIELIDLSDNEVIDVQEVVLPTEHASDEHYRINVLSRAAQILSFEIEGNPTSGYYCHSINLLVKKPE